MKICNNCHTENNEGNKFCLKCGRPFVQNSPIGSGDQSSSQNSGGSPSHPLNVSQNNHKQPQINQTTIRPQKQPYRQEGSTYVPRPPRQPQKRDSGGKKRNFMPFFLTILSLVVIVGAILFWVFRDSWFGPNVKEFAINFAEKASQNQRDSLKTVYTDIVYADSIALKYVKRGL